MQDETFGIGDVTRDTELSEFVPVVFAKNEEEAEQIKMLLEENAIPILVEDDGFGLTGVPALRRGIPLLVPDELLEEASGLVADKKRRLTDADVRFDMDEDEEYDEDYDDLDDEDEEDEDEDEDEDDEDEDDEDDDDDDEDEDEDEDLDDDDDYEEEEEEDEYDVDDVDGADDEDFFGDEDELDDL